MCCQDRTSSWILLPLLRAELRRLSATMFSSRCASDDVPGIGNASITPMNALALCGLLCASGGQIPQQTTTYCINSQKRPVADATPRSFARIVSVRPKGFCSVPVSSGRESLAVGFEKLLREHHTDRHRRHENQRFHAEAPRLASDRSRAKTAQDPSPRRKSRPRSRAVGRSIEDPAVGSFKLTIPDDGAAMSIPEAVHPDRACHDEQQSRIPFAEHIEKSDHPRRIGHPGDGEPCPEETAGDENTESISPAFIRSTLGCRRRPSPSRPP